MDTPASQPIRRSRAFVATLGSHCRTV